TSCHAIPPPAAATTAEPSAAGTTVPSTNRPGVAISPTANSAATMIQTPQAGTKPILARAVKSERRRQLAEIRQPRPLPVAEAAVPVQQERLHPERERAVDVVLGRVAHHRRRRRLDLEPLEHGVEDRRVRLRLAV